MVALSSCAPACAVAADPSSPDAGPAAGNERSDPEAAETARREADEIARRERAFSSGMLALVGIVLLGGLLVVVTILWGGSARKRARAGLPAQSPQDELWYLRKKEPRSTGDAETGPPDENDSERATPS
ncbi:MAG: hypothetical protein WED34_01520 [Planctomycetales bacterium]